MCSAGSCLDPSSKPRAGDAGIVPSFLRSSHTSDPVLDSCGYSASRLVQERVSPLLAVDNDRVR